MCLRPEALGQPRTVSQSGQTLTQKRHKWGGVLPHGTHGLRRARFPQPRQQRGCWTEESPELEKQPEQHGDRAPTPACPAPGAKEAGWGPQGKCPPHRHWLSSKLGPAGSELQATPRPGGLLLEG